jgi:hypothetical protein
MDVSGRQVWQCRNMEIAGTHPIAWNSEKKVSGMFFIVLTQGENQVRQKLLIVR